jgi:metallo-beta-lactamase class B
MHARYLLLILFLIATAAADAQQWRIAPDLSVRKLAPGVWMHTSVMTMDGTPVPANGLLVATGDGLLMIDTPYNDDQTNRLLAWTRKTLKMEVKLAISTHYHNDRLGGVGALRAAGIEAVCTPMTYALVDTAKYVRPTPSLGLDTTLTIGRTRVQALYPGAGHTRDNIVVWLPASRVLFGGCLVKADSAESLGYIADADVASWPTTIATVMRRFPRARIVIPGHGAPGGAELLTHTMKLLGRR